jgi:hypothetical protein
MRGAFRATRALEAVRTFERLFRLEAFLAMAGDVLPADGIR